jgi:ribosomal protein S18 acetylase RimI-like enzyme
LEADKVIGEMRKAISTKDGGEALMRPLMGEDADILGEFFVSLSKETEYYFHPHPLDRENAVKTIEKMRNGDGAYFIQTVAEGEGEKVVGYVWISDKNDPPEVGICVRDGWQDKGLGTHLMEHIIEAGRRLGKKKLALVVMKDNPRAVHVYEKMGFVIEGERKGYHYMVLEVS